MINGQKVPESDLLSSQESSLGDFWIPIYSKSTNNAFQATHFEQAMLNIIKQPNINSTVIMRADILKENVYDREKGDTTFTSSKLISEFPHFPSSANSKEQVLHRDIQDVEIRNIPETKINLTKKYEIVRRIIPRNPYKDHIINQTCLMLSGDESVLVVYIPHITTKEEIPFYLPPVYGIGLLYHKDIVSIHYLPFNYNESEEATLLKSMSAYERPIRIALRLLETSTKHSAGVKAGYAKRVNHDLVVPKIEFQNRYISLKKKYSLKLVNEWCESTDPKKHVFEDLAIAAFLIEYWILKGLTPDSFEFRDMGCGNGLLVYILIMEGYRGQGIDARARKSWSIYPENVQQNLLEQVIIPSVLLKPHPSLSRLAPDITDNGRQFKELVKDNSADGFSIKYHSSKELLNSDKVCTMEDFPKNTFIIGNHSDELTCWIPLFGFPFIVIPCCSHALNGAKARYPPRKQLVTPSQQGAPAVPQSSTYASLVDHVEDISGMMGWKIEKEMLRIPSTRNAAIIGHEKYINESEEASMLRTLDLIALEGGAEGWVENSMMLMKKAPRNH
ncbi:TRM44 [[Candida] subhashii]|uniref:tRNA (uracil-O(2)-)-methyltransferase n=1 Tax=[Candida] subhashii TaxID=561895 RepID=A0A8J5UHD8_9ASCO|nr:TRM44 [[Candida] subhashii]KAG7660782.1 TRM44 [[Candida] subhashii]